MTSCHIQHTNLKLEQNLTCNKASLNELCYINLDNDIILNYDYFRYIANSNTYHIIIQHIIDTFENCLSKQQTLTIHLYTKSLTLTELDKHLQFIKFFAETLKTRFPDKLEKCFVYDVSFVFYQCYSIISNFLDKKTQQKIQLIKQKTRNSF